MANVSDLPSISFPVHSWLNDAPDLSKSLSLYTKSHTSSLKNKPDRHETRLPYRVGAEMQVSQGESSQIGPEKVSVKKFILWKSLANRKRAREHCSVDGGRQQKER